MRMAKETIRQRQDGELEVIKSIYGPDVEDLRPKGVGWKPLDVRIQLTPLIDSQGDRNVYVKTKLHVICPNKYPKVIPKIFLEDTKGISDSLMNELLNDLQKQANNLKGEVMIFDLAQTVQAFLLKHNKPPRGSFYDEMLQERQKREQEQLQQTNRELQNLIDEVEKRKEIFKNEAKRREPRRSVSESNRKHASSSESSDSSSPYYHGHVYPNKCLDHRNSETLYFPKVGRQIKRGCCLGHSQKGCVAFSGIDLDTGQLLYITEWSIKYAQIETKCSGNCYWSGDSKCNGHKPDEFIANIEKHVADLSQLHHKNLINYECVLCLKRKDGIVVYLVQDFVLGTSIYSITMSLGWCAEGAKMVAKGILEALVFLHNKGFSHSHLFDTTVFMDNTGVIRCTDFSLVPNLLELIGGSSSQRNSKGDLPALGDLIESLMPTLHYEMRDFVEKCNSTRTLSASDLLEHPFLRASTEITRRETIAAPLHNNIGDRSLVPILAQLPQLPTTQSRLRTEFEVIKYLGKGAFGDVLKCRNILDNREYAIKRIPLPARSRQLYKKMTREVELLSRLNHENVVRYFNSWIENTNISDLEDMENLGVDEADGGDNNAKDWSFSRENIKQALSPCRIAETESSSSSMWATAGFLQNVDSDSDDGIEFVDSNGEVAVYEDNDIDAESNFDENSERRDINESTLPRSVIQVMYIQMEFCEKFTLRQAIDDNLYQNTERLWRLFREIAEGLSHIHQQGMIHRDLKPVNIFLDSRDQIKIGDFGLATTSFLALQSQEHHTQSSGAILSGDGTGTGKVGTTLYVAPELTGNASKSTYNQKVDMYTLGIILFEMSNPPFETGMERVKTIIALRSPAIVIPENMLNDPKYENTVQIIRWLLSHDPAKRPTAEELLASDLVPPAQLEANELQEMLRHALANPQSKAYKHLVARCLQQESDAVLELTYHLGLVSITPILEFVKSRVINLFRKHGAIEVTTPLLTPFSKNTFVSYNPVKLMTHSGSVVILPSDLRAPFARHIVMSGINMIRRYSVDRVYREKKVFNFHPKQHYECAFDIITPTPGNHLVDAELLSIAYEITTELPSLKDKNITIRINHTSLLRAILIYCNVPKDKYTDLFAHVLDFIEGKISKFHLHSTVTSIMSTSKSSATLLLELLLTDVPLGGPKGNFDITSLKTLMRGKGEASSLAKGAMREVESVVSLAQSLGVTCPIHFFAGLPISYDRASTGGIVWQMIADVKPNRTSRPSILAVGERYDTMLAEYQKRAQGCNVTIPNREICGAGLSFSLDKLVAAIGPEYNEECRAVDVGVCVSGSRPPLKDVIYILRLLWSAGIRSGIVEANGPDEAQDLAKELGAVHIILLCEGGTLRVRSWDHERFQEKHVTRTELVEYIKKLLRNDSSITPTEYTIQSSLSSNNIINSSTLSSSSSTNVSIRSNFLNNLPSVEVTFMTHDKMTANLRRRYENQVTQQMTTTLLQFCKKERFSVIVVDLPRSPINALVGAINPREIRNKETEQEISHVVERFPKHRRYISEIFDEVIDIISTKNNTPIVALYSISDTSFRVII